MGSSNPDYSIRNLTQLLIHLDRNLTNNDETASAHNQKSLPSTFERQRLRANFEHARALLLRLEHDSTSIKIASRKQTVQADLRAKRDQIKKLQSRIQALDDVSESDSDDASDEDGSGSDFDHNAETQNTQDNHTSRPDEYNSSMRKRTGASAADAAAYSTGVHGTNRATTTNASNTSPSNNDDGTVTREKTLTTDRKEQEQIMDSLLALTRELKTSASTFSGSLESEKTLLDKASRGLDSNVDGMEAAGKRMGTLRKMTEGKGFFARLKLYGLIAVLWLVAFVMVFLLPKLRF